MPSSSPRKRDAWQLWSHVIGILASAMTIIAIFFPTIFQAAVATTSGRVDRETVTAQVHLFGFTVATFVLLFGVVLFLSQRGINGTIAQAVIRGDDPPGTLSRWWLRLTVALVMLIAGIFLPGSVFENTNMPELDRQAPLAAWAVRSMIGGAILGLGMFLLSGGLAYLGQLFMRFRTNQQLSAVRRQLNA